MEGRNTMSKEKELPSKVNRTEMVYEQLLKQIIVGKYEPGARIPAENELKEEFNVSRNTIRTVLNKLSVLGIIETHRGDGSYVKKMGVNMYINTFVPSILVNEDSLMELMQLRKGIEVAASRLAAIHATSEDIERIEKCFQISTAAGSNMEIFAETTVDFHFQIVKASKSELFATIMEVVKYILTSKMKNFLIYQRNDVDSTFYHSMILECIRNHKADEAAYMMEKHMTLLVERVNKFNEYVKKHPESNK